MNDFLLYFSMKYCGDWDSIYKAIKSYEKIDEDKIVEYINLDNIKDRKYISILDEQYPDHFSYLRKPPFIIYYYGNIDILYNSKKICLAGNYETEGANKILNNLDFKNKEFVYVSEYWSGFDSKIVEKILENNQKLIIVLNCGIEYFKAINNSKIFENPNVLLITEYPNNYHPTKKSLFARNRILGAIAKNLVLISSTNHKMMPIVDNFIEYGKDVFCFVLEDDEKNDNIELVNCGAKLITNLNQVP
ncbi:DNA processing protein, SMF family [Mycoplasma phocoeninasale]|uniref:DNA processing protein, SMF family n=1 Tax=Mycoplasma phocoeninasale TaxID=2726117 RepID=A0A858U5G9_9MOLU|nr:DNA-processing protein DprA [Mycoplasma phocoeninasale]QJG66493.1 DNA processing protein, SMF family [Mycoplasma phocoeninasale]